MNSAVSWPACLFLAASIALALFNFAESMLVSIGRPIAGRRGVAQNEASALISFALAGATLSLATAIVASSTFWNILFGGRVSLTLAGTILVTTPLLFVFCEVMPRSLLRRHESDLTRFLEGSLRVLHPAITGMAAGTARLLAGTVGRLPMVAGMMTSLSATREELQRALQQDLPSPTMGATGKRMIERVLALRALTVSTAMHSLDKLVCCPETASVETLVATVVQSGFTRIPVWRHSPSDIQGIVHATDLIPSDSPHTLSSLLRQPLRVGPQMGLVEMLRRFQSSRGHMAVVESSPGHALGILTLEDILERIIGDIRDEYDPKEAGIRQLFQDTFLVDANLRLELLDRRLGLKFPPGDYDTLNGFLLWLFRKIPAVGSETSCDGIRFFVTKADDRQVEQAIVKKLKRG